MIEDQVELGPLRHGCKHPSILPFLTFKISDHLQIILAPVIPSLSTIFLTYVLLACLASFINDLDPSFILLAFLPPCLVYSNPVLLPWFVSSVCPSYLC